MNVKDSVLKPSCLLSFRAENARSFKDELELSMLATAMAESHCVHEVAWRQGGSPLRVLPTAGVFGANASGKSNLLRIMHDMRRHVLESFRSSVPGRAITRHAFRLDRRATGQPSRYEIGIVLNGVRHEYGFELDDERVREEWAYRYPKGRVAMLFHRQGDDVRLGTAERLRSRRVLDLLRPNALFLSTAAAADHPLLLPFYDWFDRNLMLADTESRVHRQMFTAKILDDGAQQKAVLQMLRAADLGITDVSKQPLEPEVAQRIQRMAFILMESNDGRAAPRSDSENREDRIEEELSEAVAEMTNIKLVHRAADGEAKFDMEDESLGTLVWFSLAGPALYALHFGAVLLVDELDASLHPRLVEQLVRLFQNPHTNPRAAQLVFNSHDTNLLEGTAEERLLGRDQIWFTQKLESGATQLYPLTRFKPRKHEAIAKRYLDGWYGASPILTSHDFDTAIKDATTSSS